VTRFSVITHDLDGYTRRIDVVALTVEDARSRARCAMGDYEGIWKVVPTDSLYRPAPRRHAALDAATRWWIRACLALIVLGVGVIAYALLWVPR
jgi:hypothetical protein